MKKLLTIIGLAAASLAGITGANAQLLTWDVSGDNSPATLTADFVATNLSTASGNNTLTRTGLNVATANNAFSSNAWNTSNTFTEDDDYISFSLQASSGYQATFTSISYAINGSNTGPRTGRWGYSINGGSFTLQPTFTIPFTLPGSLVTWDFTDFTTAQPVEFRFWAYGTTSINGGTSAATGTVRIGNITGNDLVVNGSVTVIPEPSTAALVGAVGLLGLLLRRRMRRD